MVKIIALLSVGAGFFWGGKFLASFYKEKTFILNDAVLMIVSIQNKLRYHRPPLNEVMSSLAESGCGRFTGFAKNCTDASESGVPFPQAWQNSLSNEKEICRLLGNQKDNFILFGSSLGTTDVEGQLSSCEYYKNIFEAESNERREVSERYSGLFPPLGALLGVAAAIFLI